MKEFPQNSILNKLLRKNKIDEKTIDSIVDILVDFINLVNHQINKLFWNS